MAGLGNALLPDRLDVSAHLIHMAFGLCLTEFLGAFIQLFLGLFEVLLPLVVGIDH